MSPSTTHLPSIQLEDVEPATGQLRAGTLAVSHPAGQNVFSPGDVVFGKLRPYLSKSWLVSTKCHGSGEFMCLRPNADQDARFLLYVTLSRPWLEHASLGSYGAKMPRTSWDQMASFPIPLHSVDEQRRIADFLDDHVARIDKIIATRRTQAERVQEAARSYATELVSGEPRWLTGSLRRFLRSEDGKRIPLSAEQRASRQGPFPYYGASGVIDHVDDFIFEGPRVLVSEDGANLLLRSTPIAFVADGRFWVNNHAHILQPIDGCHRYWAHRIEALDVSPWVTGSAQPKLTIDATMSLPLSAPPEVRTRQQVERELLAASDYSDKGVRQMQESVALTAEYKQSLITAAVTGELDVTTARRDIPG